VADATRIPCGEGVFWLAAVRDAFSHRIVGWRCSDRCDTDLILGALEYGIWTRDIREGQLIHHSISETVEAGVPRVLDSHSDGHDRMLVPGAPRVPDPHSDRRTVVFPRICRSLGTPGEALRLAVGVT
jgi:transposase InsO family protein